MKRVFFVLTVVLGLANVSRGQDALTDNHTVTITIPEVAILDVEPAASKALSMTFTAPTEAGNPLVGSTNSTLWLNYSSIKSTTNPTRTVSVKLGALLAGVDLKVAAAADASGGGGTIGTAASQLTLTTSNQTLISGIGSCYTGDGASKGHNLTYTLAASGSYGNIEAVASSPLTVTYTISN